MLNEIECIDVLDGLKQVDNNSIDVIISDPPYNIGKNFGVSKDNLSLEDYINWSLLWIDECNRVLKENGTFFVYGYPEIIQHIFSKVTLHQRWLIWHYTNKTTPSASFWQRSYESIVALWKCDSYPIFNKDDIREPYTEGFIKGSAGKIRPATKGRFGNKETIFNINEKGALPRDVLKNPALSGSYGSKERIVYCIDCDISLEKKDMENHKDHKLIEHPTQKPLELTERLILSSIDKSIKNTILIPFCGSGSEVLKSLMLNQNYISFDNNELYVKMAKSKIKFYGF